MYEKRITTTGSLVVAFLVLVLLAPVAAVQVPTGSPPNQQTQQQQNPPSQIQPDKPVPATQPGQPTKSPEPGTQPQPTEPKPSEPRPTELKPFELKPFELKRQFSPFLQPLLPRPNIFTQEFFKLILAGKPVPIGEKLPDPAVLQKKYLEIWLQVGEKFYDPTKLRDWAKWEHAYDGKLVTNQDLDAALKTMVSSLGDRWTQYTSEADFKAANEKTAAGIVSSGVQLKAADGGYVVELIRSGSPAHKSELHAGDQIKSVAGKAVAGLKLSEIEPLLEGKAGATVAIVYLRDGKDRTVVLTFAPTLPGRSEAALLPDGVLYLRLPGFSTEHYNTFEKAITDLARQDGFSFDYIVLDLRNNPGGFVDVAQSVVELFLERGIIMSYAQRSNRTTEEITKNVKPHLDHERKTLAEGTVSDTNLLHHKPMAVLVNGSSASSSEIASAALADNGRAILVGEKTFGKALAFTTTSFGQSELQLTVYKVKSPNGSDWGEGKGLIPNVIIEQSRDTSVDVQLMKAIEVLKRNASR